MALNKEGQVNMKTTMIKIIQGVYVYGFRFV